jgi:Mg2+/Co2+ transporter CorB
MILLAKMRLILKLITMIKLIKNWMLNLLKLKNPPLKKNKKSREEVKVSAKEIADIVVHAPKSLGKRRANTLKPL